VREMNIRAIAKKLKNVPSAWKPVNSRTKPATMSGNDRIISVTARQSRDASLNADLEPLGTVSVSPLRAAVIVLRCRMPNANHLQPAAQVDDERRSLVPTLANVCREDPASYADLMRWPDALEAAGMTVLNALAQIR
jgi:hypothetical protein